MEYPSVGRGAQALTRTAVCYIAPTLDTKLPNARGRGRSQSLAALLSNLRSGLGVLGTGPRRLAGIFAVPEPGESRAGRAPWLAALLSFIWPGAGQLYTRQRRLAVVFAIPALLATALVAYELRRGPVPLAARLLAQRNVGLVAVALVILVGAWRLFSVAQAFFSGERTKARRRRDRIVVAALAVVILLSHLGAGFYLLAYSNAGSEIFDPSNPNLIGEASAAPSLAPGETAQPTAAPLPTPESAGRVTILFTGVSSGGEQLYDSIMVVSYDPKTNSVQMVSVPRDSASFPFYFGGTDSVTHKLNEMPKAVNRKWIIAPDEGYSALVKEVSYLVGIPINFYAVMDLQGFVKMIDEVGGIDIVNSTVINDGKYDWLDGAPYGFYLAAGPQHLDGKHALAYVRSRESSSDYDRAGRQQQALIALLHKMAQPSEILALPGLVSTLGSSVNTNFPADQVADYIAKGQDVPSQNIKNVVLSVPAYGNYIAGTSASCLFNDKVAAESITLFGTDSTWYGKPAPANTCP